MNKRYFYPVWSDKSLFVLADEKIIEKKFKVKKNFHKLKKGKGPLLKDEYQWEGRIKNKGTVADPFYNTVLFDREKDKYICWYETHSGISPFTFCYAESKDGFEWEKPLTGNIPFQNILLTNIVRPEKYPALQFDFGGIIPDFINEENNLICSFYSKFMDEVYPSGITFSTSNDGINWNMHFPPVLPLDGDAHNIMWEPKQKFYILTTRSYQHSHIYGRLKKKRKRHIALGKSKDLIHWTPLITVLEADEKDPENMELYRMYILPYGHGYIGFIETFNVHPSLSYGPCEVQLSFSRDLINWYRIGDRKVFLERGEKGKWDGGMVMLSFNPPFKEEENLIFWYGGKKGEHWQADEGGIGIGKIRIDGFIGYKSENEGYIITQPLKITWATRLYLNYKAEKGKVEVEIIDSKTGKPLKEFSRKDCIPLTGDSVREPVNFKTYGNFIRLNGEIQLKFYLKNAEIFSFCAPGLSLLE